ncbi:leucine-rich repeats and immunoglobulin-like domains protein 2 [Cylas formicarius]|uniref:leucine-rich repeats and immunoglobulin-like domains protein 2 n=1 Tax=Cylas formicarius TaxID=197179 RepID=UPI002958A2BB|nr:leucine-rich repeats and immunoglobulin-like domains protein 2 [Cylas formicarius]
MISSRFLILTVICWGWARSDCIEKEATESSDFYYRRCRYRWNHDDDSYNLFCPGSKISCYNATLAEIFTKSEQLFYKIYVTNSSITQLRDGIESNISTLHMDGVDLEIIDSGFFDHLRMLEVLELPNNHLSMLEPSVFHPLQRLQTLNLANNWIARLDSRLFNGLERLTVIDLSRNRLTYLPDGLFADQTYFQVEFMGNELTERDVIRLIESNPTIRTAKLGHNKIALLNTTGPTAVLNLTGNLLEKIGDYFAQRSLMIIDLSRNVISSIEANAFAYAQSLSEIYLNDNKLRSLPVGCFSSLDTLKVLNLARNSIHAIQFGLLDPLASLQYLDLSHNALTLDFHMVIPLTRLERLNISGCHTRNLNAELLVIHFPKLKTLSVDNGTWSCARLAKIVNHLRKADVEVPHGEVRNASNVLGISCLDNGDEEDIAFERMDSQDPSVMDFRAFLKYMMNRYENLEIRKNRIRQVLEANANDSTALLKKLFHDYQEQGDQLADYFIAANANRIVCNVLLVVICACLLYGTHLMRKRKVVVEDTPLL